MTKVVGVVAAVVALTCAAVAAGSGPGGTIVFAATAAPLNGDVTLVRADGTTLDLSNSPAVDTEPVLSPNGKLVAFASRRGGHAAEYVVGIDGKGLRQITPRLVDLALQVAWAPDSRRLAVLAYAGAHTVVHRASVDGGTWVRLDRGRGGDAQQLVGWSPDGTRLAYVTSLDDVDVTDPDGRRLHTFNGEAARWSPKGRLAVARDSETWQVYDAVGRRLSTIAATQVAWSPAGRLASITPGGVVQVRRDGVGRPVVSARPVKHPSDPIWAGETHLLVRGDAGYLSYDLAHKATFLVPAAYRIAPAIAGDGSAYGESTFGTLAHSTLGGSTHTVAKVPYCQGRNADAYEYLQALPDGSGAVFAGDCSAPHDLFSIRPDGSALTRLTSTTQDELDPALSPDGTRLAFSKVDSADCAGCDHVVWITKLDGSDAHAIPLPSRDLNPILQDDRPSFSPDGTRVVFTCWNSSVSDQAHLCEATADGAALTVLKVFGGYAAWGPARIAFTGSAVQTMAPDGSDVTTVPGTAKHDGSVAAWSSDGRLALLEWEGRFDVYLPATNTRLALPGLTAPPAFEGAPGLAWSPDGRRLAFVAMDTAGAVDVWTIGVDGAGLTRVTHSLDAAGALSWR